MNVGFPVTRGPQSLVLVLGLTLLAGCASSPTEPDPPIDPDPEGTPRVLVVNSQSETISRLELDTGELTVQAATAGTWVNRITRHGSRLLLTNSGANEIALLNAWDLAPAGAVDLGPGANPWTAVGTSVSQAIVSDWLAGDVRRIDLATRSAGPPLATTPGPEGLAVTGSIAWIACTNYVGGNTGYAEGRVDVVDLDAWSVVASVPVNTNPQEIAVAADGRLHVLCTGDYGLEEGSVCVVDPVTRAVAQEIPLGGTPGRLLLASDGTAWATGFAGGVRRYDTSTLALLPAPSDPTLGEPGFTGLDEDEVTGTIWIANFDADLLLSVDPVAGTVTDAWIVGDGPVDVLVVRPAARRSPRTARGRS
ncbi:MAG: hypothetical protein R3B81_17715 [bacterium]